MVIRFANGVHTVDKLPIELRNYRSLKREIKEVVIKNKKIYVTVITPRWPKHIRLSLAHIFYHGGVSAQSTCARARRYLEEGGLG